MLRKTYTKQDIESWQKACEYYPLRMRELTNLNRDLSEKITSLDHKKATFEAENYEQAVAEIASIDKQIDALDAPDRLQTLVQDEKKLLDLIAHLDEKVRDLDVSIANTEKSMESDIDQAVLQSLESERDKYISNRSELLNQKREHNSLLLACQQDLQSCRSDIQQTCAQLDAETRVQQLAATISQRRTLEDRAKAYQAELDSYEATILSIKAEIDGNLREIASLQKKSDHSYKESFLYPYSSKPEILIQALELNLKDVLAEYESFSPASQPCSSRIALCELQRFADRVLLEDSVTVAEKQKTLSRLSGLVWYFIEYVNDEDQVLSAKLESRVLQKECLDRQDAVSDFNLFCIKNQLAFMDASDLREHEALQYNAAVAAMKMQLEAIPANAGTATRKFYACGANLLNTIQRQKKREGRSFDTKFHTGVLNQATEYLQSPDSLDCSVKIANLTQHTNHGKPSFARKLVGAMLMFLGAATSLVGIGLGAATLGMASPATLSLICAGAAVFAIGAGLFGYGCRRGINKRMGEFQESGGKAAIAHGLFAHQSKERSPDELQGERYHLLGSGQSILMHRD